MPQRLTDVPLTRLVPEAQEWNGGEGIDLLAWLYHSGSVEHAIACGELFWPDFLEFDGCIFRSDGFKEENYRAFMIQAGGNKRAVEAVMNHCHILDLFTPKDSGPSREQVIYLGRLLREMWAAKLQSEFPGRGIVVSFTEEGISDLLDYEITVYQQAWSERGGALLIPSVLRADGRLPR